MEGEGRSEGARQGSLKALGFQAILVLGAGVLGFLGWMKLYGDYPYSEFEPYSDFWERVWEALTATLGLYATSFSLPPIPEGIEQFRAPDSEMALVNTELDVARILAPLTLVLVVFWALIQGFFGAAIRVKSTKRCLSMSRSGLVICGSGELVEDTAIEESKRAGRRPGLFFPRRWLNAVNVSRRQYLKLSKRCRKSPDGSPEYWPIVIVSAFQPQRLGELKTLGIKWIPVDARREDVLRSMGLYRARAIAALDPDVSWNTDVALKAERVACLESQTESLIVARAGRDPVIPWSREEGADGAVDVTPFDFDDIAARAVFENLNPFPGLDRGICQGERVLVVATDEPVGESLVIEGIRAWVAQHPQFEGLLKKTPVDKQERKRWKKDRLRVLLVGTHAKERVERILRHQPEITSLLGGDGINAGRPVIAGWDRPPEYVGDGAQWFEFEEGNPAAAIGPREVPTVLIFSMNRHRAARAARDTGALPEIEARQGRVVAVTESGPLGEHLRQADDFETVDAGKLLANVSLFIDGGFEQRLARSLHARWSQRGARKSIGPDGKPQTPSDYFREMLSTWGELTQEEEADWLLLSKYLLNGREAFDCKLESLEPWDQEGLGFVVDGLMQTLEQSPPNGYERALELVDELEIKQHPGLVTGAFLEAGLSLEESRWASSLNRAVRDAGRGDLEDASQRVATAFREAEEARVTSSEPVEEMLLNALEEGKASAKRAQAKTEGKMPKDLNKAYKFVRENVRQIGEARKGAN